MSQETTWRCDRCGLTALVDQVAAAGWRRVDVVAAAPHTIPEVVHHTFDLCSECAAETIFFIEQPGFKPDVRGYGRREHVMRVTCSGVMWSIECSTCGFTSTGYGSRAAAERAADRHREAVFT